MMNFDLSITEDFVKELNHMQSYENLNNIEDSEQNMKKHYAR